MATNKLKFTLTEAITVLKQAACPEDVFGLLEGDLADELDRTYKLWARVCHSDRYTDAGQKRVAEEAFKLLGDWLTKAEQKLKDETYGNRTATAEVVIKTPKAEYRVFARLNPGDVNEVYVARLKKRQVVLKVVRHPQNNDLSVVEAKRLKWLREESPMKDKAAMRYVTELLDTFEMRQGSVVKRVNVLPFHEGFYSLAEVREQYPDGIDVRDAAWMWNRLLSALMVTHQSDVVHGAVLPPHFLICPKGTDHPNCHDGVLIDWSYSVKDGEQVKAISTQYRNFYPAEMMLKKEPASAKTDIYMAAKCMLFLLGAELPSDLPKTVPRQIVGLLKACLLGPTARTDSVWELYQDFGGILTELYGKRKYRHFDMPRILEPVAA